MASTIELYTLVYYRNFL